MKEKTLTRFPTELFCITWSVTSKEKQQQVERFFGLGVGERTVLPIYAIVGFYQRDRLCNQQQKKDSFFRATVNFA